MFDYLLARFEIDEEGQTMAEYAVVLAVITLIVIGAVQLLSGNINTALRDVAGIIGGGGGG
jgi:pilus assembly protein Flp/PilA